MKYKILFVLIVLVLIVGATVYSYKQTRNDEKKEKVEESTSLIVIEPESYDFGQVKLGDIVKKEFIVKNTSSDVQEIQLVSTSCGCTKAEIDTKNLEPQKEAKLTVTFNSGAHGKSGLGESNKIVYVKFKNQEIGEMEVETHATVIE